ncbi:MAG: UDP-N-acetylmuramoylalanyl-D-glutamyl-2,6-diaminopimelate--D-alanyl-D-alanyl ligase [Anaerocolumna sp.]|jgi:UDP-N-acetylmuramoyl-tripeptide--D-alanyl-D-alanine ligase|nr:UDP-N-acetylmuramoylalanyl-D-glutamyl-2,6-diaminopimelate--D-alanyl-D-alanyl ligase [Anaerocolumna sp.]
MEALSIKEIAKAVGGTILCGNENTQITFVSTNSKNLYENSLFVPVVGERVDAHDFIKDAFLNGAVACFTSKHKEMNHEKVFIAVDDTIKALQSLGAFYRSRFNIPVIGITGSVGKTTTKEMVAAALETKFKVLKTEGNMNSQVGLPLMMLRMMKEHEIAVIEMGMSEEGEMEKLTPISRPEVAIMTNIGVSHIAQLKTRENIRKEKLNIINAFHENSVLYVNGNDDLLQELYFTSKELKDNYNPFYTNTDQQITHNSSRVDIGEKTYQKFLNAEISSFGTEGFCEFRAEDIKTVNGETHFTLRLGSNHDTEIVNDDLNQDTDYLQGDGEEIILKVLGIHNVYNALAALAVAKHYGIPISVAKVGLRNYEPIAMRGQIKEVNGMKIIDDSYNASPDSMKSGINVLLELEGVKRRIAVLADVKELGEISQQCHYEVGTFIAAQTVDEVVTIGEEAAYIAKGIQDKNSNIHTISFMNNKEAIEYLQQNLKAFDGILVKGSRSMKTDEIVSAIAGTM